MVLHNCLFLLFHCYVLISFTDHTRGMEEKDRQGGKDSTDKKPMQTPYQKTVDMDEDTSGQIDDMYKKLQTTVPMTPITGRVEKRTARAPSTLQNIRESAPVKHFVPVTKTRVNPDVPSTSAATSEEIIQKQKEYEARQSKSIAAVKYGWEVKAPRAQRPRGRGAPPRMTLFRDFFGVRPSARLSTSSPRFPAAAIAKQQQQERSSSERPYYGMALGRGNVRLPLLPPVTHVPYKEDTLDILPLKDCATPFAQTSLLGTPPPKTVLVSVVDKKTGQKVKKSFAELKKQSPVDMPWDAEVTRMIAEEQKKSKQDKREKERTERIVQENAERGKLIIKRIEEEKRQREKAIAQEMKKRRMDEEMQRSAREKTAEWVEKQNVEESVEIEEVAMEAEEMEEGEIEEGAQYECIDLTEDTPAELCEERPVPVTTLAPLMYPPNQKPTAMYYREVVYEQHPTQPVIETARQRRNKTEVILTDSDFTPVGNKCHCEMATIAFDASTHILCPTDIAVRHEFRRADCMWTVRILAHNPLKKEIRKKGKEAVILNCKKADIRILSKPSSAVKDASLESMYEVLRLLNNNKTFLEKLNKDHPFLQYVRQTLQQRGQYEYMGATTIKHMVANAKDALRRAQIGIRNTEIRHQCCPGTCPEHYAKKEITAGTQTEYSIPPEPCVPGTTSRSTACRSRW